jgi:hypothetical protein
MASARTGLGTNESKGRVNIHRRSFAYLHTSSHSATAAVLKTHAVHVTMARMKWGERALGVFRYELADVDVSAVMHADVLEPVKCW